MHKICALPLCSDKYVVENVTISATRALLAPKVAHMIAVLTPMLACTEFVFFTTTLFLFKNDRSHSYLD
jgi:hypothetical protein